MTPTLISEFRFGFSRLIGTSAGQNFYKPVMKHLGLNFQGQVIADQLNGYPESIVLSGTSISNYGEGLPRIQKSSVFQFTEGLTWARNSHTFKFGAGVRRSRAHELPANYVRRGYTFSGQYSGDGFAGFLLGYPSAANAGLDLSPQFLTQPVNLSFPTISKKPNGPSLLGRPISSRFRNSLELQPETKAHRALVVQRTGDLHEISGVNV